MREGANIFGVRFTGQHRHLLGWIWKDVGCRDAACANRRGVWEFTTKLHKFH